MKFIIQPENGVQQYMHQVWDADNSKPLCTFVDGSFETEEKDVIEKLISLGYEIELTEGEPEPEENEAAIRERAKELGIQSWHIKGIDKLKEEIAKKEGV